MSKYQSSSYRTYVLVLLTFVYAVNFVDRQLLAILQESIKADLSLSDTQLGLLTGFAFAMFYVLAGIPIARWADKSNRRSIISLAIGVWSVMTALSGLAANFVQLLLARIGVGVGEAGCSPPAHSMISDMYPPEKRATALSFYSVGINVGIMIGFLLGGVINQYFGWRVAFFVVGAPGILLALWFRFSVEEPIRGWSEKREVKKETVDLGQVVKFILARKYLIHTSFGAALSAVAGYALSSWSASFYIRSHGMPTAELGVWLAAGVGIFGSLGTFGCGYLADKFGRRDRRYYLWVPAIAILLTIPFMAYAYSTESVMMSLIVGLIPPAFTTGYLGASLAVFHSSVEPRMRATSSALFFLILNIIGLGMGPTIIGATSDLLADSQGVQSLRYAMLIIVPTACVWAAAHFFLAARSYGQAHAAAPESKPA
ncbi:MAG: MFS transporter [Pseudomonadota bacterium]